MLGPTTEQGYYCVNPACECRHPSQGGTKRINDIEGMPVQLTIYATVAGAGFVDHDLLPADVQPFAELPPGAKVGLCPLCWDALVDLNPELVALLFGAVVGTLEYEADDSPRRQKVARIAENLRAKKRSGRRKIQLREVPMKRRRLPETT